MALKYSNAFRDNQTPREFYEELNVNVYNQSFENANNYYGVSSSTPVEYEFPYGSEQWHRVEARVDGIVLSNTGLKSGNDYKNFIFKPDFTLNILYGTKFRWKDNIWLVQNTDNMTSDTSKSCVVVRCNNVLRYYDDYGNKIYEPCHSDETVRFTRNNPNLDIPTSKGEYVIVVQRNKNTKLIKPNDRFLFGTPDQRMCVRIYGSGIRNYINSYTNDENSNSLTFLYGEHYQYDEVLDDLENGFTNAYSNQFSIVVEPEIITYQLGTTTQLKANVYKNKNVIDSKVNWSSDNTDVISIDDSGNLKAISVGSANVMASLEKNTKVYTTLSITIEDINTADNFVVQISPNITYLLQESNQIFEVYLYNKGIKLTDTISIKDVSIGVPRQSYDFKVIDGNHFSVTNKEMFMEKPVIVRCDSSNYNNKIEIELRGLW